MARHEKTLPENPRRAARLKAGLTLEQAAQAAGVPPSTYCLYESGGPVPPHRAELLARRLDCPVEIYLRQPKNKSGSAA